MADSALTAVVLGCNFLWFGAGFVQFTMRSRASTRLVIPRRSRDQLSVEVVAGLLRFLGGLNLGFAALALLILLRRDAFSPTALAGCLFVFAVAHGSQFAVNVPIAHQERRNRVPPWPVLRGTMLFIFSGDGVLMVANGVLGALIW